MHHNTRAALALLAATHLLAACGADVVDGDRPDAAAPASRSPGTTSTPIAPQPSENKGRWDLVLRDVRVSSHDGVDRVVVEFDGTGTPGWNAEYVKTPRADGSGEVVDVRGDNVLSVTISGVTFRRSYPTTPPDFLRGPRHFAPEQSAYLADVNALGVFEGYSQLFLGIDGDRVPFRVSALDKPARLVIELRD